MNARTWESFIDKLMDIGVNSVQGLIRIAVIVAVAYVVTKLLRSGLNRMEAFLIRATERTEKTPGAAAMRIRTLASVLWTIGCGLLWFVVVLIAFSQVGVNIGPILAGAGVVGLAAGFGAQHLVRDLVTGFFLILENQIRVGDMAIINGTAGSVEAITFRTVALRDQAGVVYVFPNGTINTLANATMDWSAYVVDVTLPYKADTDHVGLCRRNSNSSAVNSADVLSMRCSATASKALRLQPLPTPNPPVRLCRRHERFYGLLLDMISCCCLYHGSFHFYETV